MTFMTRRELLAMMALGGVIDCGGGDHSPSPPQNTESTVTLTVDGMI